MVIVDIARCQDDRKTRAPFLPPRRPEAPRRIRRLECECEQRRHLMEGLVLGIWSVYLYGLAGTVEQ